MGGKYGVLWATPANVEGDLKEAQFLGTETTTRWVAEGRSACEEGDIIAVLPNGKVVPACLPDLSDLARLPTALKIVIIWMLKEAKGGVGVVSNTIIEPLMDQLLWEPPILPRVREWVWIGREGFGQTSFWSYLNTFKLVTLCPYLRVERIKMTWEKKSNNPLDGRKWCVKFLFTRRNVICGRITRFVLWNCKGMSQQTFTHNMSEIIDMHAPDCLLLTETRCSERVSRAVTRKMPLRSIHGSPSILGQGGAAVAVLASDIQVTGLDMAMPTSPIWTLEG